MRNTIFFVIIAMAVVVVFSIFLFSGKPHKQALVNSVTGRSISVQAVISEIMYLNEKGDLVLQRELYQKLINEFSGNKDIDTWQKELENINVKIIFSNVLPTVSPATAAVDKQASQPAVQDAGTGMAIASEEYEIQPMDTLYNIAKKFNTTVELLKISNNLSSDIIIPGRKLRVWTGEFTIFVDKSQNVLVLKSNNEIVKTYNVATGLNNSTPIGTFKVVNKLRNPVWYKAGAAVPADSPENILGTRWLGFDLKGYGIHGTTDPATIGSKVTSGCIRMLNSDVEELYALVPQGIEVTVVD